MIKHIKRMDNNCHISDLAQAFSNVENGGLNLCFYCQQSERFGAIKPGLIHYFLHLILPVPSQEYDSCCPFVFNVFYHLILPCGYGLSDLIFF